MRETVLHVLWFSVVSCALAYVFFIVAGNLIFESAAGSYDPVMIRDELSPGLHHLSGIVTVPQTCDELVVHISQLSSFTYELSFQTWQEPSVPCEKTPTARYFSDLVFAPSLGVDFVATVDQSPLPIAVVPVLPQAR